MKSFIFAIVFMLIFSGPAFSVTYDYTLSPGQDTFTDSYYDDGAMGYEGVGEIIMTDYGLDRLSMIKPQVGLLLTAQYLPTRILGSI